MIRRILFAPKSTTLKIIAISVCLYAPIAMTDTVTDEQYQQALELARTGNTDQALKTLEQLVKNYPKVERYRYDYIQILSWANRDDDALLQEPLVNIDRAPTYVLEALARAARNRKDFKHAERLYRICVTATPDRFESQLGLASVLIDQKQADSGIAILTELAKGYPQNNDVLLAMAYGYEEKKQFLTAVMLYEDILTFNPNNQEALRCLVFDLNAAGSNALAYEKAKEYNQLFSDEEWARLNSDEAAGLIRWSEVSPFEDKYRFYEADLAINAVKDNIKLIDTLQLKAPDVWRSRARIDLMIPLRQRYRMKDVIAQYDILQKQKVAIPEYSRSAVADAFLYLEQPEKARDLYLSIIKETPDDFNARYSLVYAYLETEQYDEAVKLAQQLTKEQPDRLRFKQSDGFEYTEANPKKTQTALAVANLSAYGDHLNEAVESLEDLYNKASFNADIRNDLAQTYYFRGWPRLAEKHYGMALNIEPKHLGLKTGHAQIMRELQLYRKAEKETEALYHDFPEDKSVQKQMRLWNIHNDWEFKSFNSGGISTNDKSVENVNPRGSQSIRLDNYLYSKPLDYNYRMFVHQGWGTSLFPMGPSEKNLRGYLQTYGLGLEYSAKNVVATSEVHYDRYNKTGVGVALGVNYEFDDHWQLSAGFDSLDNNISLKALTYGIRATTGMLDLTYKVHESRQFGLGAQYSAYSQGDDSFNGHDYHFDGNDRFAVSGSYFERWYSGPRYKFGTYVNAGYSTNSSNNVPYFNPKNDASVSLTLDHDYLTYRYYNTAFNQKLGLSVGNYWQDGYGSHLTGSIQYEHHWKAADRFELTYGASRIYTAYDGNPTTNWLFYLNTDLRF